MKVQIRLATLSLLLTGVAHAQMTLTGRYSELRYDYVYGFGGDTHSANVPVTNSALLSQDTESHGYIGSDSGVWASMGWSAAVGIDLQNEYSVEGSLSDFSAIRSSGTIALSASKGGVGGAGIGGRNPGNQQFHYFTVPTATPYDFFGNLTFDPSGGSGFLALQVFDSIVWQNVRFTYSLPGAQGNFSWSGTLAPGSYRLYSEATANFIATNDVPSGSRSASYNSTLHIGTRCTGSIVLQDYVGVPRLVTFQIVQGATTETRTAMVDPNVGTYEIWTNLSGPVTVYAKGSTWLRQARSVANPGLNMANFTLKNGNCNGDSVIDLSDYTIVITAFNAVPVSANWDIRADLNGDGVVDLTDYTIVVTNFNAVED